MDPVFIGFLVVVTAGVALNAFNARRRRAWDKLSLEEKVAKRVATRLMEARKRSIQTTTQKLRDLLGVQPTRWVFPVKVYAGLLAHSFQAVAVVTHNHKTTHGVTTVSLFFTVLNGHLFTLLENDPGVFSTDARIDSVYDTQTYLENLHVG